MITSFSVSPGLACATPKLAVSCPQRSKRSAAIRRRRSSRDRRQVDVTLAEEGKEHIRKVYDRAREHHIRLLRQMGPDDAEEFIRLMNLAIRTISAEEKGFPGSV